VHQAVAIQHGVHRADGWQVRARELLPTFLAALRRSQPGYFRFKRTIAASIGAGSPIRLPIRAMAPVVKA